MSLVMLCFPCCDEEQPPPRRRPKIDRSMIGEPIGFKHTGHIGSGEVSAGFDIHNVQDQMQSKGGYEYTCALSEVEPKGIDLKNESTNAESDDKADQQNGPQQEQNNENSTVDTSLPNRTDELSNQL